MPADLQTLLDGVAALLGRRDLTQQEYQAWHGGSATGGPDGDGYFPLTDSTGFTRLLPSPAKLVETTRAADPGTLYPDQFDSAAGSSATHDDAPAIKAMLAQSLVDGRLPALRANKRYYLGSTITLDPSRQGLRGNGAVLDFRLKAFVDPNAQAELLSDAGFDSGSPWISTSNTTLQPVYTASDLVFQPAAGTYEYLEVGQRITCAAGQALTVTITVDEISTVYVGPNTFRSVGFSLRAPTGSTPAGSIATGANVGTIGGCSNQDTIYATAKAAGLPAVYTFSITPTVANPYLRVQGNSGLRLGGISIKPVPENHCMLIRTPATTAGGQLRGHNYRELENFKIAGRSDQGAFVDGILFDTPSAGLSSRAQMRNVDISDGMGRGLVFANRTYLNTFINMRVVTAKACVETLTGSADAGENISFFGGNFGGGECGIRNPGGMDIRLFGTSIDFSRQWIVGGNIKLIGGHLEMNAPTVAGYPMIDATGDVNIRTTSIIVDGSTVPVLDTPFRVGAGAILDIEATVPYNLGGTSGALCSGAGRFRWRGWGGANKVIPAIAKRDADHSILGTGGSFDDAAITIPAWMPAATGQQKIDRYTVGLAPPFAVVGDVTQGERAIINTAVVPNGLIINAALTSAEAAPGTRIAAIQTTGALFNGTTSVGSNVITTVTPQPTYSVIANRYVTGPGIPPGARVLSYNSNSITLDKLCSAAATITLSTARVVILSQPWNGPTAAQVSVAGVLDQTARETMALSTDAFRSGTQSLKLAKVGSGPTSWLAHIAVPIEADRAIGAEWWYKIPAGLGTGVTAVYFTTSFVHLQHAEDAMQVPQIGQQLFISDLPQSGIDLATGRDWTLMSSSTNRVDPSTSHDGYAPAWATHFLITVNLFNTPNGFVMYLDDLHANLM